MTTPTTFFHARAYTSTRYHTHHETLRKMTTTSRLSFSRLNLLLQGCVLLLSSSIIQAFIPFHPFQLRSSPSLQHQPLFAFTEPPPAASSQPIRRYQAIHKDPVIVIVGRPNVGKSALVNRIANAGTSVVADESGITRDRTYQEATFLGENFTIVDTGGLVYDDNPDTLFTNEIKQQAMVAIQEASAVVFVVDVQQGLIEMDRQVAKFLRQDVAKKGLPVRVAVNKCESTIVQSEEVDIFRKLGLGKPIPVSALHGHGVAELLESVYQGIVDKETAPVMGWGSKAQRLEDVERRKKSRDRWENETDTEYRLRMYGVGVHAERIQQEYNDAMAAFESKEKPREISVAIVGRPNVGKSSLLNALFGDDRAIVSDVAGTTRDSIDVLMERPGDKEDDPSTMYRFIDTAGIRKKTKVKGSESLMVRRALRSILRADIALLVLDATVGVTDQDRAIAEKIVYYGKACAILCNKWDAVVDKDSSTYQKSLEYIRNELSLIDWAPIVFVSAATGQRVGKVYGLVDQAIQARHVRIQTSVLNEVLRDAILWQAPPVSRKGGQAKLYYCHQVSSCPPTIVVFCNHPRRISDNYRRYLDRKFRESLEGLESTPIQWIYRSRRRRDILRERTFNGDPGDGGRSGTSYPYPHAF
eukprot:Nitzschia sp. Nitz4//scaffold82_size85912//12946//14964//NITZ4_005127-RA/size85912-augustus-gene-0.81-mRNA-1//-1//CDS//3329558793//6180//frame0